MKKPILTRFNACSATNLIKTSAAVAMQIFSMLFFSVMPFSVFGQAPVITYSSPQTYLTGVTISPLGPTTAGVASPVYNNAATFAAGYPAADYRNATISVDKAGNIFTGNYYSGAITKTPVGGGAPVIVATVATDGPRGVVLDETGNIYAGINNGTITKIPAGGGMPVSIGTTNQFKFTSVLAVDGAGNLYVGGINIITKIPANGGSFVNIPSGDPSPTAIAIDPTGKIYVVDGSRTAITKIPAAGGSPVIITINNGFIPYGIAIDKNSNIFLSGFGGGLHGFNTIQMIPAGGAVPVLISDSILGDQQSGDPLTNILYSLALDGNDNIYVGDAFNGTVQEIQAFGTYAASPALPAGLDLDITSGIITGTPTASSPATNYTVTAYTSSGNSSAVVNIKVLSNNANLANLSISKGVLTPAFSAATISYTDVVSNTFTSVTVTPTVSDPTATVTVNGVTVASGMASVPITLIPGPNVITTKVTAQDGITTKTYTTTVTQHPPSSDDNLSNIGISPGYLDQVFYAETSNYTASENYSTTAITVTPTTEDINATVKINGTNLQAGSASINVPLKIGLNTITATVTAEDGITSKSYAIKVNRAASSNPYLSNLTFSDVVLDPAFLGSANLSTYVYSGTTSTTVTATAKDSTSTITVNGMPAISGRPSGPVALNPGHNLVTIVVTAGNGIVQKTYLVNITKRLTSGIIYVLLNNLTISSGAFTPPFVQYTPNYTVSVGTATTSISVTPTSPDARDTVKVNGIVVQSGSASGAIPLNIGPNIVTVYVAAPYDYNTITYTIIVTRTSTANAALANLTINNGTLTPAFTAGTTAYTALVGNDVTAVTLTPTTSDPLATVKVNGLVVSSGSASAAIPLIIGTNTITTVITAADRVTTKTYTTTVTRAPSSNAYLTNLYISSNTNGAQLSPSFGNGQNYTITLNNAISSLTVTAAAYSSAATITVNGFNTPLGTPSANIPLIVGDNTITVIVTAQDGITKQPYKIVATRLPINPSTNSSLSALAFSRGSLSPSFTGGTTSYILNVMLSDGQLSFTPTAAGPGSTITFNGQKVASGYAYQIYDIYNGGVIPVTVTAQDGVTTTTYAITINILPSANANLINLVLSNGILTPAFALSTINYNASVSNSINFIDVTPTANNSSATIQINGLNVASSSESPDLPLSVGLNTVTTIVTAQDGITKKIYTVVVNRLPSVPSSNSSLGGLTLSSGTLSPVFAAGTNSYTVSVNSISSLTVTPVTGDVNATVQVNGAAVNTGTPSAGIPLVPGANIINTVITSPDGTSKTTYTIAVTLIPSANANLIKLALSSGMLTPAFAIATGNYTAAVSNATTSVIVTPTTNNNAATVQINGVTVASNTPSPSIPLAVGNNTITTTVTAQDGITKKTYAITVTRASGSIELLRKDTLALAITPVDTPAVNDGLLVHPALSPNGDGINDYLVIDKITDYPDNNLKIMDRNGVLVFEARGYDNASRVFDGHSSKTGVKQQPGTYFYSLQYKAGSKSKYKTGYLVIKN